jgi:lysophospholipase L1-like esterase
VLIVTLLVCVAVIDAVAYFALGVRGSRHGSEDFVQFSPVLGHFHRPLAQGRYHPRRGRDGHDVRISSRGFCDEERDIEKTRPRIVLIGDSTTGAWEVDPHERPHRVLEEVLGGRFEVLNLGVRGYGTDQSLLLLKHLGMAFRPDVVIYTFCINDIRDNAKRIGKPYFEVDEADTGSKLTAPYGGGTGFDFDEVTRLFEGFADDAGVAFVSLARVARRDELPAADLMPPGDTIHLSAEGIRLWASAVAGVLKSRGWLEM